MGTSDIKHTPSGIAVTLYKAITLAIFFILPKKVSRVFVSLSVLALIYQIRKVDFRTHHIDCDKFTKLLKISFNEEVMVLPNHTVNWFWKKELLDKPMVFGGQRMTLRQAILSDDVLFKHLRLITSVLLNNIHGVLKFKLGLRKTKERLAIRHNVVSLLIYG